jgi:integral membrane sensor domain MASE1
MKISENRASVSPDHPLLRMASLGLLTFIFTLFSLELTRFGTILAPLWFPTSIMMVAFYRHAGKMWPAIAAVCSASSVLASLVLFPFSHANLIFTGINLVEAVLGALLLRKFLPGYNPLQNLLDWIRLAVASAIVPPPGGRRSGHHPGPRRKLGKHLVALGAV